MKPRSDRCRLLLAFGAVVGICALIAGILFALMPSLRYPGGMTASYRAGDHDPRLSEIAREAVPMIAAVEAFYARHGACPRPGRPAELAEFCADLAGGIVAERRHRFVELHPPGKPLGWLYDAAEPAGGSCTLWRKLGWDPALVWRRNRDGARWIFAPGDGSDEREIAVDPR